MDGGISKIKFILVAYPGQPHQSLVDYYRTVIKDEKTRNSHANINFATSHRPSFPIRQSNSKINS